MRHPLYGLIAVTCLASPLVSARTEALSWGKPSVSIEQYRADAVTCGRLGYYADVSNTEAAQTFKRATRNLEANEADLANATGPRILDITIQSARIVEGTRPAERMKTVGTFMQDKVDDCLKRRDYVRFKLTANQRQHLSHLHLGSPERHAYLYDLATDPQVLNSQAM